VFDLDGTLADTAPDLIAAINEVGGPAGLPPLDPVADRIVAGQGGRAMLALALARAGRGADATLAERLLPAFIDAYAARIAQETRLFPGVEPALDTLAAEGWRLAVCTNKPEALALRLLDALGARARFAAVVGAGALAPRKPDPTPFHESVRRAGGAPGRAVMVGDTATDRETARRAGAPCVLVAFGYGDGPPEALCAEAVAADFSAIPPLLRRLAPATA
jgi:phosphoglycolate phosphatase